MTESQSSNHEESHYGKLGRDLPDTENELFQLNNLPLLDIQIMKDLVPDDWENLLRQSVAIFIEKLPQERKLIEQAHENRDWKQIDKLAHKMKGGCLYLGTKKLATACQYLERYIKANHTRQCENLYQQMINVLDETLPAVDIWLKSHHK